MDSKCIKKRTKAMLQRELKINNSKTKKSIRTRVNHLQRKTWGLPNVLEKKESI